MPAHPPYPRRVLDLSLAAAPVRLLPEGALVVLGPGAPTLVLADVHLGKPATFAAAGLPVPEAVTRATLARLDRAIERCDPAPDRVVILGDLLHARRGRDPETFDAFARWRRQRAVLPITLVRGNHDRSAGDPPADWGIEVIDAGHPRARLGPFAFAHEPPEPPHRPAPGAARPAYVLCGHVHPVVTLREAAGTRARLRCFVVGPDRAILPAFGLFTGGAPAPLAPGDRALVIADDAVIDATAALAGAATRPRRRGARAATPENTPRP